MYGAGTACGSKSYGRGQNEQITKPSPLERLVHRRRLVDAPDDRLEVVDVERPRIEEAVPAHDVERVVVEHHFGEAVVLLDDDREVALLVEVVSAVGRRKSRSQYGAPSTIWPYSVRYRVGGRT